jgi:cytochrome o ubiquinol oxidase operon protein cyoD
MSEQPHSLGKTMTNYIIGFVLSVVLTLVAYVLATSGQLDNNTLVLVLAGLAAAQTVVQLLYFLHLRDEKEPRWKLLVFDFMMLVVAILVIGTMWIMNNLNYHMPKHQPSDQDIIKDEGIYKQ